MVLRKWADRFRRVLVQRAPLVATDEVLDDVFEIVDHVWEHTEPQKKKTRQDNDKQ